MIEPSAAHTAVNAGASHSTLHPPSVSTSQFAPASTKMSPQASSAPASASSENRQTAASELAPMNEEMVLRNMGSTYHGRVRRWASLDFVEVLEQLSTVAERIGPW
jgi:hypothetical protein